MNRVLFKAAAIVNIAAAALIYVACSGDDGKDGPPGPAGSSCVGTPSATPGAIDITCGGVPAGTLQPGTPGAPGQNGQGVPADGCYLSATSAAGTYTVVCGGAPVGTIGGPGGTGGGCTIVDNPANSAYLLITCGTETQDLAKAMCGTTPYDPKKWACDYTNPNGPTLQEHRCGTAPYDPDVEFCQNGTTVKPLCGPGKEEYTADQFCQPTVLNSVALTDMFDSLSYVKFPELTTPLNNVVAKNTNTASTGTIQSRCGPTNKAYAAFQFCFANTSVYQKCGTGTSPGALASGTPGKGIEYEADQLCSNGVVSGNCGGLPYVANDEFCQSAGVVKLLCGAATEPLASRKYTADQFCQIAAFNFIPIVTGAGAITSPYPGGEAKLAASTETDFNTKAKDAAKNGVIKSLCVKTGTSAANFAFLPSQFCQSPGTQNASAEFLCDGLTLLSAKEYPSTSFCQYGTGNGEEVPASGGTGDEGLGIATDTDEALDGTITPKCVVAGTPKTFGNDYYCSSGTPAITAKPICRKAVAPAANRRGYDGIYYDPEIEFCLGGAGLTDKTGSSDGKIYPTCAARASANGGINIFATNAAAADKYYDPTKKVCETRGNILYSYEKLPSTPSTSPDWLAENVKPNNVNTFTWTEAQTACPGSEVKLVTTLDPASGTDDGSISDEIVTKEVYPTYGWGVPTGKYASGLVGQWYTLANGTGTTAGNAGIELRAKSVWTNKPTNDTYSKFAALPATVTGISPAPTGNYAYWWTADEGGYAYDVNGNLNAAGTNFNMGNYVFIEEESTALGTGASGKLTTKLSVRCVK